VITFRRPEAVRNYVDALIAQTTRPETILVVDNGGDEETRDIVCCYEQRGEPVRYLDVGDNRGPAGAAALGLSILAEEGYVWILWGDDDGPPQSATTLEDLLALPARYGSPIRVGAVGLVGQRWDWRSGQTVRLPDDVLSGVVEVDAIGGG
jgi:GT2 family glycosyltransferase